MYESPPAKAARTSNLGPRLAEEEPSGQPKKNIGHATASDSDHPSEPCSGSQFKERG